MRQSVLVRVDGSPASMQALAWSAQYAKRNDLDVLAVHVLTYSTEFWRDLPPTGLTNGRENLRGRLEHEWVAPLQKAGVPHRTALIEADSVDGGLLRLAAEEGAALMVLGTRGHDDLKDRVLGGVTSKVSHRSDRPVAIVPADWNGAPV